MKTFNVTLIHSLCWTIPTKAESKEKAMDFVRTLDEDELIQWGQCEVTDLFLGAEEADDA